MLLVAVGCAHVPPRVAVEDARPWHCTRDGLCRRTPPSEYALLAAPPQPNVGGRDGWYATRCTERVCTSPPEQPLALAAAVTAWLLIPSRTPGTPAFVQEPRCDR